VKSLLSRLRPRSRTFALALGGIALPLLFPSAAAARTAFRRDGERDEPALAAMRALAPLADLALLPLLYPSALLMRAVRHAGVRRLPRCRSALLDVGIFPIRDDYYEPRFDYRQLERPLREPRDLPGIDWNVDEQLALLEELRYGDEIAALPRTRTGGDGLFVENPFFGAGDIGYWYNLLRARKPRRLIEIGSGYSTLVARRAIARTTADGAPHRTEHVCIEPHPSPIVRRLAAEGEVRLLEERVERVGREMFGELGDGDVLFIDSSHMIRPQGDVLFEYLELLPSLRPGVIVHVHDIFSPRDYLERWLRDGGVFWNEQYLLESFLSNNREWKIIGAVNLLAHDHFERLRRATPFLTPDTEPGSFYIQKIA
jgi:hypothetical protein